MSRHENQVKRLTDIEIKYAKLYNKSSKKNGADGAYNHLRGMRDECREQWKRYTAEIEKIMEEITPVIEIYLNKLPEDSLNKRREVKNQYKRLKGIIRRSKLGTHLPDDWQPVFSFFTQVFRDDCTREKMKRLILVADQLSTCARHETTLSRIVSYIANNDFPEGLKLEKGILSDKCLTKLKEIIDTHSAKGSDWIYEKAYEYKECQFEGTDEDRKKIGSWRTFSRRVKKHYPDLHKRTFKHQ